MFHTKFDGYVFRTRNTERRRFRLSSTCVDWSVKRMLKICYRCYEVYENHSISILECLMCHIKNISIQIQIEIEHIFKNVVFLCNFVGRAVNDHVVFKSYNSYNVFNPVAVWQLISLDTILDN